MTRPLQLLREAAVEYLEYDSTLSRQASCIGGLAAAGLLWTFGDRMRAFTLASRVHRSGGSDAAAALVERTLRNRSSDLRDVYRTHIRQSLRARQAQPFLQRASALLGYRAVVIKSARERERGVILTGLLVCIPTFRRAVRHRRYRA